MSDLSNRSSSAAGVNAWMDAVPQVQWQELCPASTVEAGAAGDPRTAMAAALVGAGFLDFAAQAAAQSQPLTFLINDAHRFTDTRSFFDVVFGLLDDAGTPAKSRVLVATGSHRSESAERQAHEHAQLGPWRDRFDEVAWHDAQDPTELVTLGHSEVNRRLGEGGFYVACGSMEPHYFAGVTGAHKTLTVGVMSLDCLRENHSGAMSPQAAPLRLDNNPVHLGIVATLADLEDAGAHVFALNQVLAGAQCVEVTAGHPLAALSEGLDAVRRAFAVSVERGADVVVAEVGPPLDRDFYQADKGIKNTEAAVRDNGVLVVEAACHAGVGIDHFVKLLGDAPTHSRALRLVEDRGYRLGDHKAVRLRALTDDRGVCLVIVSPGLDPSLGAVLGAQVFASREQAIQALGPRLQGRGLLVRDAGNMALEVTDRVVRGGQ